MAGLDPALSSDLAGVAGVTDTEGVAGAVEPLDGVAVADNCGVLDGVAVPTLADWVRPGGSASATGLPNLKRDDSIDSVPID